MVGLDPYEPHIFFPDLDTVYLDSLSAASDEDRCYHFWALVYEYLNLLIFQHTQGEKRLSHAPQRAWRIPPQFLRIQDPPPSAEEFASGRRSLPLGNIT